jgi:pectinesterase
MKRFFRVAALAASGLAASVAGAAGVTITVTHELDTARPAEIVAVPFAQIAVLAPELRMYHVVVRDRKGRALPLQITNYQHDHRGAQYDDLVFSYDFAAGEKRATFTLEPVATATPPEAACVYARFIPERLDDMAWENDRIAHRMYGTALNTPAAGGERLRGSGIDVWAKRVTYPIIDRWYAKGHDQFHKDGEGEGLDLYSIGGARGAGGTGVWDGKKLWTSDNFFNAQVLANGPRRASFKLSYAPWDAGAAGMPSEVKQFTVDCGRNFDAVEDTFDFGSSDATIGLGLTEHKTAEGFPAASIARDPQGHWMSVWEESKDGGVGVAVVVANDANIAGFVTEPTDDRGNTNHLLLVKAGDRAPLHYFTGAGWNKSGQFADRAAWEKYVADFAARTAKPLSITVSARP